MFEMYPDRYGTKMEDIATYLRLNCKPYLREIKYLPNFFPLYRGMKHNSEDFVSKDVRLDDRRPADMDDIVHSQLNSYFNSKFGQPFRNALFVAGTPHVAESFGKLYTVFPEGDFEFVWSPNVYDLHSEHGDLLLERLEEDGVEEFIEYMDSLGYTNKDMIKAIESNSEIMIRCKSYAAVRVESSSEPENTPKAIHQALTKEMKGWKK